MGSTQWQRKDEPRRSRRRLLALGLTAAAAMAMWAAPTAEAGVPCPSTSVFILIKTPTSKKACAPANAPDRIKGVVAAANEIRNKPYRWGGGHSGWGIDSGYDCSGAVSYAMHGGGWLSYPKTSGALAYWGQGQKTAYKEWMKVFANSGHVWMRLKAPGGSDNGIRWDTSGTGGTGPSWHNDLSSSSGYHIRHPKTYF
jgi:cell wall-associated NlpC family hydrolase